MKKRKAVNYINNKDLFEVMSKFYYDCKEAKEQERQTPKIPEYVGKCFLQICNKLSSRSNFANYTYRDEMVEDGIENCIMAVYGFNPERSSNPFAYFTQIAWNAFIRRIKREKKETYIKHKNFENNILLDELMMASASIRKTSERAQDVISDYEEFLKKDK